MFELTDREIALISVTIALLSFGGGVWHIWRDRPRLLFFVGSVTFHNKENKKDLGNFVKITIANVGFRPSIIKRVLLIGDKSTFHLGMHDEPGITYGVRIQRFPVIIDPGQSVEFHPIMVNALKRHQEGNECHRYKYMLIIDGFDHKSVLRIEDILNELGLVKVHRPLRGWRQKLIFYISCKIYLFNHRNQISM